jgi:hypothetical protein
MQRDADRLRSSASTDNAEALQKLDELMRGVDDLPTLNAVAVRGTGANAWQPEPIPADAPWWKRVLLTVRGEMRSLVRVGRIQSPEAILLAPEQSYFLRENLKLKLLNARLSLLSRQMEATRSELAQVTVSLNRYFDPASRRTQAAATLLQQLQTQCEPPSPCASTTPSPPWPPPPQDARTDDLPAFHPLRSVQLATPAGQARPALGGPAAVAECARQSGSSRCSPWLRRLRCSQATTRARSPCSGRRGASTCRSTWCW